jgi:hypothetical protein
MEQLIHGKVIDVMADMEALGKDRRNTQQGYNFRGIDDVYNMVQPIMAKHGIIMRSEILAERSEERQSKGGSTLIYRVFQIRYFLMAKDGSEISTVVMGEGMDSGDKAANKAMSVAQKYAILQMFMIPTEEAKDPEHDSPEVKGKDKKPQPSAPATEGKTKDKSADKPAPMTDDQMKEIASHIEAYQQLTKRTDEEMSAAIKRRIKVVYDTEISGLKDITSAMAKTVISTLQKWTATELKKKMDAANNSPANDGATGGPSDPGEGSEGDRG